MSERTNVCGECGHEQEAPNGPCGNCSSMRIIPIKMAEQMFGPNWRDSFDAEADEHDREQAEDDDRVENERTWNAAGR